MRRRSADIRRVLIEDMVAWISKKLSKTRRGTQHLQTCRITQWVDGYRGAGAPCSTDCLAASTWLTAAQAWLAADDAAAPMQLPMLAVAS